MKCPKCQTELPKTANFCLKCGERLNIGDQPSESSPTPDAERKRVTALFSDLTGYTAMTEKLDPEEVKEIKGRIFNGAKAVVSKYEGFIEKFLGDGVLALFGVPRAHEDDPVRAIRAAREIHWLVEKLSPRYEIKIGRALSMHSGINTGLVVTADVNPEKGTHSVTGDAINVAARLSDLANASEILVGPETYDVAKTFFNFQQIKPVKVKGKVEPTPIYKFQSTKSQASSIQQNRQVSSEMVGRDNELAKLELQVLKAINGEGSVMNVIGEAGIGKSRLIAELKKRDIMKRVMVLEGRAISIGKNLQFHPIIDLLKNWAAISEDDTQTRAFKKLEQAVRKVHSEEADEILPFVATLMGMKLKGRYAERIKGIEGEALEKLITKNIRELVIKGSELRPTVTIMEDLHWADTSSIELLEVLYRLAENCKLLFINVFRPGYLDEKDQRISAVGDRLPVYYVEVEIQPLKRDDSQTLIKNMLEIKGLPYSIRDQIVNRAGGNPFFIEEVVRSLIDEGAVVKRESGFEVTNKINNVVIPPTINDVLMARIDRLEEHTRELVKVASVIGRNFFDRIIKEVADSIDNLDDRLSYLKNIQLIRDRIRMRELEYLFKHALAQEAAYGSILLQQRKALHLKVAQSTERLFQERLHEFYGMLAHHYSMGEDAEKAEEYLIKAGEEALKSSASSEALHYYKEAMELYIKRYGESIDTNKMIKFEENIAFALFYRGHYAEAVYYFDKVMYRLGVSEPKNKISLMIMLIKNLTILIKNLYLPSVVSKRVPASTDRDLKIINIMVYRARSLGSIDAKRLFIDSVGGFTKAFKYDWFNSQILSTAVSGTSVLFSWTGFSFHISQKILDVAENKLPPTFNRSSPYFHQWISMVHKFLVGDWQVEHDEKVIDYETKIGATFDAAIHLIFTGFIFLELGKFDATKNLIKMIKNISEDFNDDNAKVIFYHLNALFLKKIRRLDESLQAVNESLSLSESIGQRDRTISLLGTQSQIFLMKNDLSLVKESLDKSIPLISNEDIVAPYYYSSYLMGVFLYNIARLEEATRIEHTAINKYKKEVLKSGKKVIRNSKKVASERTRAFLQMGKYYWIIGKQKKAIKWWNKSINEGNRLGARPDLSRTYFEVGKRLSEPQSNFRELNGMTANEFFEKAKMLFEEMNLQYDLDELDKL